MTAHSRVADVLRRTHLIATHESWAWGEDQQKHELAIDLETAIMDQQAIKRECDALLAALERLEWDAVSNRCPVCLAESSEGHDADCWLGKAIEEARK